MSRPSTLIRTRPAGRTPNTPPSGAVRSPQYANPVFGDRDVDTITTDDVLWVLTPIWNSRNETASRVRGRIENILDYATVKEYRTGENPARWRGHLAHTLPARKRVQTVRHHPALPYEELPTFMATLRATEGVASLALEFTIMTAARTNEIINANWDEIHDDVWIVPAGRMKAGVAHRVPLSAAAMAVIDRVGTLRESEYVFPGFRVGHPLSITSLHKRLVRLGYAHVTVHGFRSTFRDWCAEQTSYPREVAEAALAHTNTNRVEAAYRRGDLFEKRRQLMDAWCQYCEPARTGVVVALASR